MPLDPIPESLLAPIGDTIGGLLSFGADIVGSLLAALFGSLFGGNDIAALQQAVLSLRSQLAQAVDQVTRFAWTIATALGAALKFLYTLLQDLISKLWQFVKKLATLLQKIAKELLPKLVQLIKNIRTLLNWIYKTFIRPIIQYLQLIRRFLGILRLFHIKWAGKLDGIIVNIEGRIVAPFLYVLRTLNGLGNWINVVLTAGLVLQRAVFINTMYAYQSDWVNMFWVGQQASTVAGTGIPVTVPPVGPAQFSEGDLFAAVSTSGTTPGDTTGSTAAAGFDSAVLAA